MKRVLTAAALASLALCLPQAAIALDCNWQPAGAPAGMGDLTKLLPAGNSLDNPAGLNLAVDQLRKANVNRAVIIDNLIGLYCPVVEATTALSDAQKNARMRAFASRVTRVVYNLESADAIILDVPLAPSVSDALNAKAAVANQTPAEWAAQTLSKAVN